MAVVAWMRDYTLDLSADTAATGAISVAGVSGLTVQAVADSTGWGSTTAVVTMKWSADEANWLAPTVALALDETTTFKLNYDATGLVYVRFEVTTAQSDAGTIALSVAIW